MAESIGIEPIGAFRLVGALAVRWLTICLTLGELWRWEKESNHTAGLSDSPRFSGPFADHSAAPTDCQRTVVPEERFELITDWFLRPAPLPLGYSGISGEHRGSRTHHGQLCRLPPNRLA